jgi:hypothetical protein
MRLLPLFALVVASTTLGTGPATAQAPFQLSTKFVEASFVGQQKRWDGQHRFGNVVCLQFPHAGEAQSFAQAMYNHNTLYFSRITYQDPTALYVVASTVPVGRSAEDEISKLAAQNQKAIEQRPQQIRLTQASGELGPSLTLTVRNAKDGGKDAPFPFVRTIDSRADAPLSSVSVHRLFVHEHSRIELAGLRYFKTPITAENEAQAITELTDLVEQAAGSLQTCTAKLHPKPSPKDSAK